MNFSTFKEAAAYCDLWRPLLDRHQAVIYDDEGKQVPWCSMFDAGTEGAWDRFMIERAYSLAGVEVFIEHTSEPINNARERVVTFIAVGRCERIQPERCPRCEHILDGDTPRGTPCCDTCFQCEVCGCGCPDTTTTEEEHNHV